MKKIKVGIYCIRLTRGGAERVSVYLSKMLFDNNFECDLIIDQHVNDEYSVPKGVNCICLEEKDKNWITYFRKMQKLHKVIKQNKYDILIVMEVPVCFYVIPACIGSDIKTIVSERNAPKQYSGNIFFVKIARFFMRFADGFVFQTHDAKVFYNKRLNNRGTIIPNPVFLENLPKVCRYEKRKVIVNVGRLTEQKNQKMLIRVFSKILKKYPEYILEIYGDGPLREELIKLVNELGIEKSVFLRGNVSDVLEKIKDATCFVLSSRYEGMPNALIEAMALALPVVSTDCPCGGPKELIKDKINGLLVRENDEKDLYNAIMYMISNPILGNMMGKNALEIRERLNSKKISRMWIDYILKILQT